jgi:hypothetical protein
MGYLGQKSGNEMLGTKAGRRVTVYTSKGAYYGAC